MWGEIDCDVVPDPATPACGPEPGAEKPRLESSRSDTASCDHTEHQILLDQGAPDGVSAMLDAIAQSGSPVKSQQIGDAELTVEQRRNELLYQYRTRPLVFLERYQAHIKPQHLEAFSHLSADPRAQHYCREVQRRAAGGADRTRLRNQRYAALRALQKEGQYFSEEQMRVREPLLYEQYIGQYLSDEELLERSQEAMQGVAGPGGPGGGPGGLADLLLNSYQEKLIQCRLQEEQDEEEGAQEEEEEEGEGHGSEPTPQEKLLLREEFLSVMHQRFLDGKDKDFNYSEVDNNPDYDNLDILSRDAEEKYFDDDDDDEEEEEEEEEEGEEEEDMTL